MKICSKHFNTWDILSSDHIFLDLLDALLEYVQKRTLLGQLVRSLYHLSIVIDFLSLVHFGHDVAIHLSAVAQLLYRSFLWFLLVYLVVFMIILHRVFQFFMVKGMRRNDLHYFGPGFAFGKVWYFLIENVMIFMGKRVFFKFIFQASAENPVPCFPLRRTRIRSNINNIFLRIFLDNGNLSLQFLIPFEQIIKSILVIFVLPFENIDLHGLITYLMILFNERLKQSQRLIPKDYQLFLQNFYLLEVAVLALRVIRSHFLDFLHLDLDLLHVQTIASQYLCLMALHNLLYAIVHAIQIPLQLLVGVVYALFVIFTIRSRLSFPFSIELGISGDCYEMVFWGSRIRTEVGLVIHEIKGQYRQMTNKNNKQIQRKYVFHNILLNLN